MVPARAPNNRANGLCLNLSGSRCCVLSERLAWDAELKYGTVVLHQNRFSAQNGGVGAARWLASCKTLAITVRAAAFSKQAIA